METLKGIAIYVALAVLAICIGWSIGKLIAPMISDIKIINPKEGIECVVVSRMFNTSVDCWKADL